MADKRISALTLITAILGGEPIPLVQGGNTMAVTAAMLAYLTPQAFNGQTGTTYAAAASDLGKLISLNNAGAIALSINTGLGGVPGQRMDIMQLGAGQVTVGGTATVNTSSATKKLRAQYSVATLICVATDSYVLIGDLATS